MNKLEQINQFFTFNYKATMRVKKEDAKELLLNNCSLITGGAVWYFVIRDLGLGICEIGLRYKDKQNTFFVKDVCAWMQERKWTHEN